jgi:hypothetical protein
MAERHVPRPRTRPGILSLLALGCLGAGAMLATAHATSGQATSGTATSDKATSAPSFCLDHANPAYATDRAVAVAASRIDHLTPRFVVLDTSDSHDAMAARKPAFFARLAARCDLVMGFPVDAAAPTLPAGVTASAPYARTGFVLAARGATAPEFAALPPHARVGTSYLTVPTTWFTDGHGATLDEHEYSTPADLYHALASGAVDAALIWQPWLVRHLAAHPAGIAERTVSMPNAAWNLVALYRPEHRAAAARFDREIRGLARSGRLAPLIAPFRLPH